MNALEKRVNLSPVAIPGMTFLNMTGLRIAGTTVDAVMSVRDGRVRAALRGLPDGWRVTTTSSNISPGEEARSLAA